MKTSGLNRSHGLNRSIKLWLVTAEKYDLCSKTLSCKYPDEYGNQFTSMIFM